jgi:transcription factor C subunit 3
MWQQIRNEEKKAENIRNILHDEGQLPEDVDQESAITSSSKFEPMDARHLSSLPLLRARVVKLLKASKNQMHESNNIMLKLVCTPFCMESSGSKGNFQGFVNPTKTDRRFFRTRIRELIHQEVIEQVLVPNKRKKDPNAMIKCFRLVSSEMNVTDDQGVVVLPTLAYDDEKDDDGVLGTCDEISSIPDSRQAIISQGPPGGIKTNATIHKQITDLLSDADTDGITLNVSMSPGAVDDLMMCFLLRKSLMPCAIWTSEQLSLSSVVQRRILHHRISVTLLLWD